jgi:hypothetical protein
MRNRSRSPVQAVKKKCGTKPTALIVSIIRKKSFLFLVMKDEKSIEKGHGPVKEKEISVNKPGQ